MPDFFGIQRLEKKIDRVLRMQLHLADAVAALAVSGDDKVRLAEAARRLKAKTDALALAVEGAESPPGR